jgi:predicted DNA-binding transcriptional regulator
MANTITRAEREKILVRAHEITIGKDRFNAAIAQIQREFGISQQRAKSAVAKAYRQQRHAGQR